MNVTMWGWVQKVGDDYRMLSDLYPDCEAAYYNRPAALPGRLDSPILCPFNCADTTVTVTYGALGIGVKRG